MIQNKSCDMDIMIHLGYKMKRCDYVREKNPVFTRTTYFKTNIYVSGEANIYFRCVTLQFAQYKKSITPHAKRSQRSRCDRSFDNHYTSLDQALLNCKNRMGEDRISPDVPLVCAIDQGTSR